MLGKLISHEWKDTWKLMTILNGAVIVLSVLGMFFAATGNLTDIFNREDVTSVWVFVMYISFIMVYILGIIALSVGTTLYFYVRFYRNLYTDQGYLMHTLPVTEHELILSKAIVAFIWKAVSVLVVGLGIGAIVLTFAGTAEDIFREILPVFSLYNDVSKSGIFPMIIRFSPTCEELAINHYSCVLKEPILVIGIELHAHISQILFRVRLNHCSREGH